MPIQKICVASSFKELQQAQPLHANGQEYSLFPMPIKFAALGSLYLTHAAALIFVGPLEESAKAMLTAQAQEKGIPLEEYKTLEGFAAVYGHPRKIASDAYVRSTVDICRLWAPAVPVHPELTATA